MGLAASLGCIPPSCQRGFTEPLETPVLQGGTVCFIGGKLEPSAADWFPGCDSCLLTQHVNVTYFPKYVLILWFSAPEAMGGGLPHAAAAAAAAQPHVDHFILLETPLRQLQRLPSGDPQTSLHSHNKAIKCDEGWNVTKCGFSYWISLIWTFLSFKKHFWL